MKTLIALFMAGVSCMSMAAEQVASNQEQKTIEQYTYGTHMEISTVVSQSEVPDVCGVVPAQMTYIDHQGQQHTMEYQVMGNGCSRG